MGWQSRRGEAEEEAGVAAGAVGGPLLRQALPQMVSRRLRRPQRVEGRQQPALLAVPQAHQAVAGAAGSPVPPLHHKRPREVQTQQREVPRRAPAVVEAGAGAGGAAAVAAAAAAGAVDGAGQEQGLQEQVLQQERSWRRQGQPQLLMHQQWKPHQHQYQHPGAAQRQLRTTGAALRLCH